ncbi:MAG: hypothetical protein WEB87_06310 [Bacteriovoracaceae bacterium]
MKSIALFFFGMCFLFHGLAYGASSGDGDWKPKYSFQKDSVSIKSSAVKKTNPKAAKQNISEEELQTLYKRKYSSKVGLKMLKDKTLSQAQKSVPVLIQVMKSSDYPDKNRWIATFMLGRIMGKKSGDFISKFAFHPNWTLRLASLKVLLALDLKQFKGVYARALKDEAMIVRMQALENIKMMKLEDLAPYAWAMLYDKSNYAGQKGNRKRAHIIKQVIALMGDLGFEKAKKPMLSMIQDKKYKDIFDELDYSLNKLSKKPSPEGNQNIKKHYWSRLALKSGTL